MNPTLGILLLAALILANGFFVAAQFSLVAARRAALEERAQAGSRRARAALAAMRNISFTLSGAQLGITATSLLVGYLAEPAFAVLLRPVVQLAGVPAATALAVSFGVAFAVSAGVQMVVGELAPKNLAIAKPEQVALAVAIPVRLYEILLGPFIRLFDGAANVLSRLVGVEPQQELLGPQSIEEIARIVAASGEHGSLTEEQTELMLRVVELAERRVAEVMIPRPDVVWVDADASVAELRELARRTGHSRFPVRGADEDDVVGTVHLKDLLRVPVDERGRTTVSDLASPAVVVPESYEVRRLLADLREQQRTFAVVADEYGGIAGIVTLEDVLEELVGEIEDEFDPASPPLRRVGAGRFLVPGAVRVDRMSDLLDVDVPPGEYDTVAGFVIDRLGRIPCEGDEVHHDGWRIVVARMDGNRVAELRFDRPPPPPATVGEMRDGGEP